MADPASPFEAFTRECIYKAFPFRSAQWERWLDRHRGNYKLMETTLVRELALTPAQAEIVQRVVREYL